MSALSQFVGATVECIGADTDGENLWLELRLPDGSTRMLSVYHPFHEQVAVRIDGQYVPPEEL